MHINIPRFTLAHRGALIHSKMEISLDIYLAFSLKPHQYMHQIVKLCLTKKPNFKLELKTFIHENTYNRNKRTMLDEGGK